MRFLLSLKFYELALAHVLLGFIFIFMRISCSQTRGDNRCVNVLLTSFHHNHVHCQRLQALPRGSRPVPLLPRDAIDDDVAQAMARPGDDKIPSNIADADGSGTTSGEEPPEDGDDGETHAQNS